MDREEQLNSFFTGMELMHRLMHQCSGAQKKSPEITRAQMGALFFLLRSKHAGVKDMAEAFGMTPSAVTQIVNSLVASGYVERITDVADRRKVQLTLTKSGKATVQKAKLERRKYLSKLFAALSDRELSQLTAIQQKLIEHMKQYETKR